jgi:DNA repair photolyase
MPSIAKVDETGKITVSLGGSCRLRCKHCYITAPQFSFNRNLSVEEVVNAIHQTLEPFDTVCISGDTDPLLRERDFIELLYRIVDEIRPSNLMFTTRLIPSPTTLRVLYDTAEIMFARNGFILPCVSFVSSRYPNGIEDHMQVPSPSARAELLRRFREMGMPTFAALRPTFPFEIVPAAEIDELLELVRAVATCVLGEVFLLDSQGAIAKRLNLPAGQGSAADQALTFLDQGPRWQRRVFVAELEYVKSAAAKVGVPFFLRSMSAIRLLKENWDLKRNRWRVRLEVPPLGCYDHLPP